MEMVMEKTPVIEIVESLENTFASVGAQKEISFNINYNSKEFPFILTDKFRLEQILKNLLSNAFKFTQANGNVTLTISKPADDVKFTNEMLLQKNAPALMFAVSDTGIGIAHEKLNDIFDAFKQADGSTSRKYGGTGLGLSISKQLAGLLGGEIQVESVTGKGSTFYVYLPVAYTQSHTDQGIIETSSSPEEKHVDALSYFTIKQNSIPSKPQETIKSLLAGKKILIVDDDERNFAALSVILDGYGLTLTSATNGKEALTVLQNETIDLVLMDIVMPEMDGYEAISQIRSDSRYAQLPVIIVTAMSTHSALEKGALNGATAFLQKPIDIIRLLKTMQDAFGAKKIE
jgi:two-component system chemotaxis sensor kinase CheA